MNLQTLIEQNRSEFTSMFRPMLTADNTITLEFSDVSQYAQLSAAEMDAAIFQPITDADALAGVGGYLENRSIYRDTDLFQGDTLRCIHIGVDVFMPAGTPVYAPLAGRVHSFANRRVAGDYGPVIILQHQLDGIECHSLYGDLDTASLDDMALGKFIARGEKVAQIGPRAVNGNWTPHLHFQLIQDMQDNCGDYPGVVRADELDFYRQNCPDPMPLILG